MIFFFFVSVVVMTLSGSVGAIFFKKAMSSFEKLSIGALLKCPSLYIGGGCYAVGLVTNMVLMQFFDYTIVYPSSALTYVWTLLISVWILKEKINWQKIAAIICIVLGIVVMNL